MWSGLAVLLVLSASLAASSYFIGLLPLTISLSRRHMRLLTALGTGILLGIALIVIIPEGVEALYSARSASSTGAHRLRSRDGLSTAHWHSALPSRGGLETRYAPGTDAPIVSLPSRQVNTAKESRAQSQAVEIPPLDAVKREDGEDEHTGEHHDGSFEPHAWVGTAVISGFVLMYLIDKLPKLRTPGQNKSRPAYISLQGMGIRTSAADIHEDGASPGHTEGSGDSFKPSSTTTGLVIHAAADGIALGASSAGSTPKLGIIIFIALMIHKAPAAFALTVVLLKQGLSKREARAHLLVFSLAAPVGALATYLLAHILGAGSLGQESRTTFVTGLLVLFSGGTFLYVAMHTMQDAGHDHGVTGNGSSGGENGYADIYAQRSVEQVEGPGLADTLVTVAGMLFPLLTQVGHSH